MNLIQEIDFFSQSSQMFSAWSFFHINHNFRQFDDNLGRMSEIVSRNEESAPMRNRDDNYIWLLLLNRLKSAFGALHVFMSNLFVISFVHLLVQCF